MSEKPKLKWCGSGTGAGYYIDLYETEDGKKVLIGSDFDTDSIRMEIASHFTEAPAKPRSRT